MTSIENPETERAIKEHCADKALGKLIAAGCERRTLINGLSILRDSNDSWKELVGQAWPGFKGDLKRKLESSIRQIRECATEIEKLESTQLWSLMLYVRSDGKSPDSQFAPWSQALNVYAATWSDVISKIGPKRHPFSLSAKAFLVAYVERTTGDWHDEEMSALLAAVTDNLYDAHAHLQWRHDNEALIRNLQETELPQTKQPKSND